MAAAACNIENTFPWGTKQICSATIPSQRHDVDTMIQGLVYWCRNLTFIKMGWSALPMFLLFEKFIFVIGIDLIDPLSLNNNNNNKRWVRIIIPLLRASTAWMCRIEIKTYFHTLLVSDILRQRFLVTAVGAWHPQIS